ncbi:ras guanine nucleotide exchange factor domain-containing protein [Phycomyces nitens]|nr:ras guanine nucleotide exchange factor domain-containing protein [Phycomyces nitens]
MSQHQRRIDRVRAIYPFNSGEPSALEFRQGDIIEVLAKLESGWWDGWCNGRRGWFPSNYVQLVETNEIGVITQPATPAESIEASSPNSSGYRTNNYSYSAAGLHDTYHRRPSYPEVMVNGEFVSQHQIDHSHNWAIHPDNASVGSTGSFNENTPSNSWTPQHSHMNNIHETQEDDMMAHHRIDPQDEKTNPNQFIPQKNSQDFVDQKRLSVGSFVLDHGHTESNHTPEEILAQWTERTTPNGRVYFCNMITQETTWDFDEVDKTTGRLSTKEAVENEDSSVHDPLDHNDSTLHGSNLHQEEPLTWQSLSSDIALVIHKLNQATQNGQSNLMISRAAAVVAAIRIMLYSSRAMEKEVKHLQDPLLHVPRNVVMSAVSKLVLSARMASEANGNSEPFVRVQRDAANVLTAVRNFVAAFQERQIPIDYVRPKLLKNTRLFGNIPSDLDSEVEISVYSRNYGTTDSLDEIRRPSAEPQSMLSGKSGSSSIGGGKSLVQKTKYPLNQDLIVNIKTYANQIYGSTDSMITAADHVLGSYDEPDEDETQKARSEIVLLFRHLSTHISQYMGVLEEIELNSIDSAHIPSLSSYRSSRQTLYTSVGFLFGTVQNLTNTHVEVHHGVYELRKAILGVENAVENILGSVNDMVEERKAWLGRSGKVSSIVSEEDSRSLPPWSPGFVTYSTLKEENEDDLESVEEHSSSDHEGETAVVECIDEDILKNLTIDSPGIRKDSCVSSSSGSRTIGSEKLRKRQYSMKIDEDRGINSGEPWYLGHDHNSDIVLLNLDGTVKGGTLVALVERLTMHNALDTSYIATFLLTYKSFCKTEEFVDCLERRYNMHPPEGLTPEELEDWTERKQKLVRLRVFNVIKNWLENYYNREDEMILDRLEFFTTTVIRDTSSFAADQLERLIRKRRETDAYEDVRTMVPNEKSRPIPIIPKNTNCLRLLDADPLEMARQLSLMDFKLYSTIRPIECLSKAWSLDDSEGNIAVNVKQSIDYCNRLTCWVTDSILSHEEAKKRAVFIKHWTQVADRCRGMNNYNTCMAILSAFDNSAIGRLRKTWELVGNRTNQMLGHIRKLMGANRNFTEYREMIHSINPPCIPFLGIYLQDLTFIEDGNPDFLKTSNTLINFAKRQKTADVIREIKQFQSPPYPLQALPRLQAFIRQNLNTDWDVDQLYKKSLLLEPRETL